jgi:hypothetical protein
MRVIHLHQRHTLPPSMGLRPAEEGSDAWEETVRSQYNIAKFLINDNIRGISYPVVREGDYEALTYVDATTRNLCNQIKSSFHQGFPENFSTLSTDQKRVLIHGAAEVLVCLKLIATVYPSNDKELYVKQMDLTRNLNDKVREYMLYNDYELTSKSFTMAFHEYKDKFLMPFLMPLELKAIEQAKQAIKDFNHQEQTIAEEVVIIFGAGHNFTSACIEKSVLA